MAPSLRIKNSALGRFCEVVSDSTIGLFVRNSVVLWNVGDSSDMAVVVPGRPFNL
jgi:hypothetical protein